MSIENSDPKLEKLEKFSKRSDILKLHAQAHAREILKELNAPEKEWPIFQKDLDIRLTYAAHYQIWKGLQLLEANKHWKQAKEILVKGAEALEFLHKDVKPNVILRDDELLKASLTYYISGHYARSYVLMKEIFNTSKKLSEYLGLIVAILKKDFKNAYLIILDTFTRNDFTDDTITNELTKGNLSDDVAISRILFHSLCRVVLFYLEYIKTGDLQLLENALHILDNSLIVAKDMQFVDWWWLLFSLQFFFKEYRKNSLWNQMQSFTNNENTTDIVKRYIRRGLRETPPVIDLWPSQVHAIPMINDTNRRPFCLKMPTSSGKTRIAELTILRFFFDKLSNPNRKCVYIAPFRSLAVEIEKTLRNSFASLEFKVSEIYGGFELTPVERRLIQDTQILVATPEKFDALIRYMPEIEEDIGLVIIDEGHIVDPNERGLRFEFFLHRLLQRYKGRDCRFLFISAVLPNAKEFAEWITGSPGQLIQSEWRPSRLMIGKLAWNGRWARIDYTHIGRRKFGQDCFVPRFIEVNECRGLPGVGKRRLPFPNNAKEAFALAALLFAQQGMTLVFVPQKRQVESFGKVLLEALKIQKSLAQASNKVFKITCPPETEGIRQRCKKIIESEMGIDSPLINFLNNGFLVHHSGLPQRVRVAIEDLVRANGIRLIVATTTLAQGVNLPIKTVLVRGLRHGYKVPVNPLAFWNICGRAGRAGKENEGQVLFCIDQTVPDKQRSRYEEDVNKVLDTLEQATVISATRLLLQLIVKKWRETHPQVNVAELCIYLANNSYDWVDKESRSKIRNWIDILDGHLLALSEELDFDPATPNRLQEILEGSLLFIQLRNNPDAQISIRLATKILYSRIHYIRRCHSLPATRKRLYKLGMPLSDCEIIENQRDKLYELFNEATSWYDWNTEKRFNLLLRISQFVLKLNGIKPKVVPEQWPIILSFWLKCTSTVKMIENNKIKLFAGDSGTLSIFLEDICGYRLTWGVNSILNYLKIISEEREESLPLICSYFSSMFKYGLNNAVAICIMPYVDRMRDLALITAKICPYSIEHPEEIVWWFKNLTEEDLTVYEIENTIAKRIISARDHFLNFGLENSGQGRISSIKVTSKQREVIKELNVRDKILVVPRLELSKKHYQIFSLDGKNIGIFQEKERPVPQWWDELHLVDSSITDIQEQEDGHYVLSIRVEEI
ncbi:MAG: DEAD/DEAH box helicase [Promethearchaeota archaeon]